MAELISSGKIVKKPVIVVNPNFFLPPGVVDARPMTEEELALEGTKGQNQTERAFSAGLPGTIEADPDKPIKLPVLRPPTDIAVKSQRVRNNADGTSVVDVVLAVPDVEGATGYDVRITNEIKIIGEILTP